jgi:hypothetical protein
LPEAIDAAPARGPKRSGGWRRRDILASRGMGEAQGKKVALPPLRLRRSRRSRPTARSSHGEAVGRMPNSILARSRGQTDGACKGARLTGRGDGGHGIEKGRSASEVNRSRRAPPPRCSSTAPGADCRSAPTGRIPPGHAPELPLQTLHHQTDSRSSARHWTTLARRMCAAGNKILQRKSR